ncbi:complement C3-like [Mustelus asterias]
MRKIFLLLALLVFIPAIVQCNPLYVLTAPNVLRVDSEENAVVEAHGIDSNLRVDMHLQFFPQSSNVFRSNGTLTHDRGYLSLPIKIPRDRIPTETPLPQYVVLEASSSAFHLKRNILISYQIGHIFIQTDKPIYTPTQDVLYRLLSVNNEMKPITRPILVNFLNPQGVIAHRDEVAINNVGITGKSFKIPEIVNIGVWKIAASYKDASHINYTTEFEVKEYVLPSFEVILEPEKQFFYVDDVKLDIAITARFTYGEPVEGRAFVLFGIMKNGEKLSIPSSLQAVPIAGGKGQASLTSEVLKRSIPNIEGYVGYSFYVTASVITYTGSDMVEAEKVGIKIVTSPYTIVFKKTSKYYKPGMPFGLMVFVTNPDGSPASGVPVKVNNGDSESTTQADGIARLTINTGGHRAELPVKVETNVGNSPDSRQASASMVAEPYRTQSNSENYLHIHISSKVLNPGDDLPVQFILPKGDAATQKQIKYFTYMLINKGKIVTVARQERKDDQFITMMLLRITPNLIPSFRLVAYYYLTTEVVADSIWVDVTDTCIGKLEVTAANSEDKNKIYKPGTEFHLKLTGDPGATVGLVVVDKAVFVLNKKNKLTQSKIWNVVEKNDIACTPGGGKDVFGVFSDAGLTFVTSTDIKTPTRAELKCIQPMKRKRRSTRLMDAKAAKLTQYKAEVPRRCCRDGMNRIPMGFPCAKRAKRIQLGDECKAAFLDCCNHLQKLWAERDKIQMTLARSDDDFDGEDFEEIYPRTQFPESWLWIIKNLVTNGDEGVELLHGTLKDSITTWELQAVSMSPQKGICVAQPYELMVKQEFFVDLRFPYSVVRNEQVEIRAILYNYAEEGILVRVEFPYNKDICSSAKPSRRFTTKVKVPGKGSSVVPYVIIPLIVGEVTLEVRASVYHTLMTDGVQKRLRVVPEGKQMHIEKNYPLDPKGKQQVVDIKIEVPEAIVPYTQPNSYISVQGNILAQTIENSIDATKLKQLIRVPYGCGEQNMASITPVVIVTNYLDKTKQWERVGIDRRDAAVKNIQQGYAQQMSYRRADSSYASFSRNEGSTWLTAYVVKVFSMSFNLMTIDMDVICGAANWLILHKQKADGHFQEDAPVLSRAMTGGVAGSEGSASLTAFVLIALLEARFICTHTSEGYENSVKKSEDYLENRIGNLQRAYSVAIATYALSLLDKDKSDILMRFASPDQSYWADEEAVNSLYTIEATGYAILALSQLRKFDQASEAVKWLSLRSEYGGGFKSTQATMVALQGLAKYQADKPPLKEIDLDVVVNIPGREAPLKWRFNSTNKYVSKSEGLKAQEKLRVIAHGQGQGLVKILTSYHVPLSEQVTKCKNFELRVTVEEVPEAARPPDALNSLEVKIYARYLGETDAAMVIIDISMLTGFSPDLQDLKLLKNGVDKYISRFELNKALSTQGSLIIYLDSVLHTEDTILGFKVHQFLKVGLIQPASVRIYEYYDTENTCTKFYNVHENSTMLSKICQGDVCRCAEGSCVSVIMPQRRIYPDMREEKACESGTDYVYNVTFNEKENRDNYIYYKMEVNSVIKQGSDVVQKHNLREFITHANCETIFDVDPERHYLLMGQTSDLWYKGERISYLIGAGTWIEQWPEQVECQGRHYRLCEDLETFAETLMVNGCST